MALVILDRDGVINQHRPAEVRSPEEWAPLPGSLEAVARLNHAGRRVVVITPQPGLAQRLFDIEVLDRIHQKMHRQLAEVGASVEAVFICPHAPRARCGCRPPKPGLIEQVAARLRVSVSGVPVVVDSSADVEAARAAGARPLRVRTGPPPRRGGDAEDGEGAEVYDDLAAAVDALLVETSTP